MAKTIAKKHSPKKLALIDELENLKRKTAVMQSCHGQKAQQLSRLERGSALLIVIAGASLFATTVEARNILAFLTEEDLSKFTAFCSLFVAVFTLIKYEMQWGTKAGAHSASLNALTRFLRHIDMVFKAVDDKSEDELETLCISLAKEYSDISDIAPKISSAEFLKLKQKHLQIIAVSRALDKEPFTPLRKLYARFKNPKKNP